MDGTSGRAFCFCPPSFSLTQTVTHLSRTQTPCKVLDKRSHTHTQLVDFIYQAHSYQPRTLLPTHSNTHTHTLAHTVALLTIFSPQLGRRPLQVRRRRVIVTVRFVRCETPHCIVGDSVRQCGLHWNPSPRSYQQPSPFWLYISLVGQTNSLCQVPKQRRLYADCAGRCRRERFSNDVVLRSRRGMQCNRPVKAACR